MNAMPHITASACTAIMATTAGAVADPGDAHRVTPHATVGGEVLVGAETLSAGARSHVGADLVLGDAGVRPSLGVGATIGFGQLSADDPRALDGSVDFGYLDYGPELALGLRWVDGGLVDTRVFVSAAYLVTDLDDRLMLDPIDGVGGTRGLRAAIGANWADAMWRIAGQDRSKNSGDFVLYFMPTQAELAWVRSGGSDRFGATLAWGF